MFFDPSGRDFLEDSDSSQSFEGEEAQEESQNPASFQPKDEDDEDFGPSQAYVQPYRQPEEQSPPARVQTPPRTAYQDSAFRPIRKAENEKVNILRLEEEPKPTTASARPASSSAAMRAMMLERQRSQYNAKKESFQVSAAANPAARAFQTETAPYEPSREFRTRNQAFAMPIYEPGKGYGGDIGLAPVKAERTKFALEEIEEVKLDETKAARHEPAAAIKNLQKIEEPVEPPPVQTMILEEPPSQLPEPIPETAAAAPCDEDLYAKEEEDEPKQPVIEEPSSPEEEETKQPPEPPVPQQQTVPRPRITLQQLLVTAMENMPAFLDRPIPRDFMLQCTIVRAKSGFNRLYPKYFLSISDTHQFLLAGRKRPGNKTSNYLISMSEKDLKTKSPSYLGKVRSNFMGTEFMIYDKGLNPKKKKNVTEENLREELGVITYQSNLLGAKGPRKMRVLLPAVNAAGERCTWKPFTV